MLKIEDFQSMVKDMAIDLDDLAKALNLVAKAINNVGTAFSYVKGLLTGEKSAWGSFAMGSALFPPTFGFPAGLTIYQTLDVRGSGEEEIKRITRDTMEEGNKDLIDTFKSIIGGF